MKKKLCLARTKHVKSLEGKFWFLNSKTNSYVRHVLVPYSLILILFTDIISTSQF